jgi:hypothetical protein
MARREVPGWRALPPTGATGLEPATSGVTGRRSNQLSYAPSSLGLRSMASARRSRPDQSRRGGPPAPSATGGPVPPSCAPAGGRGREGCVRREPNVTLGGLLYTQGVAAPTLAGGHSHRHGPAVPPGSGADRAGSGVRGVSQTARRRGCAQPSHPTRRGRRCRPGTRSQAATSGRSAS